jgi:hypothetical protein
MYPLYASRTSRGTPVGAGHNGARLSGMPVDQYAFRPTCTYYSCFYHIINRQDAQTVGDVCADIAHLHQISKGTSCISVVIVIINFLE